MCGICFILYSSEDEGAFQAGVSDCLLQHRGPDVWSSSCIQLSGESKASFAGYTLHFRGQITKQPLQNNSGDILLWNGEIFDGIKVNPDQNDGEVLLDHLGEQNTVDGILGILAKIQGPWGMLYWQENEKKLWFGRDVFGRRSLLWQKFEGRLALSSVRCGDNETPWFELPAYGIYCLEFNTGAEVKEINLYPWVYSSCPLGSLVPLDPNKFCADLFQFLLSSENVVLWRYFNKNLEKAVESPDGLQIFNTRVTICTSGIQVQFGLFNSTLPDESIDCRKPVQQEGEPSIEQLYSYVFPEQLTLAEELVRVLGEAVRVRVTSQSVLCDRCMKKLLSNGDTKHSTYTDSEEDSKLELDKFENIKLPLGTSSGCGHARVAILFSGGIDSLIIAALADKFVPPKEPIDLLNVAFQQKTQDGSDPFAVPDRMTGLLGLSQLNPQREWNFVKVNVTLDELQQARAETVRSLVYPLCTVLDDSIGCAIWFAARGKGLIDTEENDDGDHAVPYTSTARVVLVGMGADEQLVGYTRHRAKFNAEGWPGLMAEIQMEIERISARNLGRDDRVISDNGRESRFPFLDEKVVAFLNALPLWLKANLCLPRGVGEKYLLRLAASLLGLQQSALLPKRAIQFGSRIAKMENRKEKASDTCSRLQSDGK